MAQIECSGRLTDTTVRQAPSLGPVSSQMRCLARISLDAGMLTYMFQMHLLTSG